MHFYTVDFYEEAADRLEEGGVLCQWLPVHASDPEETRNVVNANPEIAQQLKARLAVIR